MGLRYGGYKKEVPDCIKGNIELRKGAASMVYNHWKNVPNPVRAGEKKRLNWVWEKLGWWDKLSAFDIARKLFDDPEKEVGQVISRIFREPEILENRWFDKLARRFLKSNSFSHSLDDLTSGLKDYPENIVDFADLLFSICERVSQIKDDPDRRITAYSMADRHLPSLLLRLYHQSADSKNKKMNEKCLDAWDKLLLANFGDTRSQLGKLDQTN